MMDILTLLLTVAFAAVVLLIFRSYRKENNNNESQLQKKIKEKAIPGFNLEESKNGAIVFPELTTFLLDLHKRFGLIAKFYLNERLSISIADPELMKELRHLEVTPTELFEQFEIISGRESFGFQQVEEIRRRRKLYDHHFMLKACKTYTDCFVELADEYIKKWKNLKPDKKIPLMDTTLEATLKAILRTNYGDYFKDEKHLKEFQELFVDVSTLLEKELKPNTPEHSRMQKNVKEIQSIVKKIMTARKENAEDDDKRLFIDVLLEDIDSPEAQMGDSILFIQVGYEATGKTLMWALYELAAHPEIQDKLYEELKSVLGGNPVSLQTLPKLEYLNQVVEETLRYRIDTLFTVRRVDEDLKVGDYAIPADSDVYMTFGAMFKNESYFANPDKFDPDHFSPQNVKKRNPYAWKPFGFAGKRQCPGQSYARITIGVFLAEWCRQYRFSLSLNQELKTVLGIVWRPEEEIWVIVEPRN